ncbi:hypothetical protein B0A48_09089 [Cryoendolithus antarcticus]|uniref:SUZ domain-containing protein n=1 Tax=Cryoendolithus antarcticus TaxID=1507870 RepID=A0A1V8T236_9PEZI|nr:hypothetical protein B0A48_09089 [Cryoendolithus antarcticus]
MASPQAMSAKPEKLSFAAIAAAGIKPPKAPSPATTQPNGSHPIAQKAPVSDSTMPVIASSVPSGHLSISKPKRLVQLSGRVLQEPKTPADPTLIANNERDGALESPAQPPTKQEVPLAPAHEDASTGVSSSDGDGKPRSNDGKSQASGTAFTLDEKDSLRPDDSASVQAAPEDDDGFGAPEAATSETRSSEDAARPFRGQLKEIDAMEPSRRALNGSFSNAGPRMLYVPPTGLGVGVLPDRAGIDVLDSAVAGPDSKLLEALENPRDRIWVLKLEQDIIDFVKDTKESSLALPQCHAFYRLLAHKIADYYSLGHAVDDTNNAVRLFRTPNCRIPQPLTGIVTPSTAASTPPPNGPQMKILRRGDGNPAIANGSNMTSSANSESGEDDRKKAVSREEREKRYEAARLRIMGSSKPAEPLDAKDNGVSRSNSAAGKRKKKPRDTDDDFQARSAYSSFFTPSSSANSYHLNTVAYPTAPVSTENVQQMPAWYNMQQGTVPYSGYINPLTQQWSPAIGPSAQDAPQQWNGATMPGYDVSSHFAQAMMLQQQSQAWPANGYAPSSSQTYQPMPYQMSPNWQQLPQTSQPPQYHTQRMSGSADQISPMYSNNGHSQWPDRPQIPSRKSSQQSAQYMNPSSTPPQSQKVSYAEAQAQGYAYGLLPSAALGRPPNALEHPLPGSYKNAHFNPQSRTFVPGQVGSPASRSLTPSKPSSSGTDHRSGHNVPHPLDRQMSNTSHHSNAASSYPNSHTMLPAHPLTHPLPQPVFPRQPSPHMSLPAKPSPSAQPTFGEQAQPSSAEAMATGQSSIAKWGTPASLPPKPPPPAEPFDLAGFAQGPRMGGASYSAAVPARQYGNGVPGFGYMPPMLGLGNGVAVSGGTSPGARRM